jgi:hypothetical protein
VCNLFGYGEIKPLGSRYYERLHAQHLPTPRRHDNFQTVLIERKEDIQPSFKGVPRQGPRRASRPEDHGRVRLIP